MALKKTISLIGKSKIFIENLPVIDNGTATVDFDAYFKVVDVVCSKEKAVARVVATDSNTLQSLQERSFEFVPDLHGDNFIKQAYDYIKSLDEFADFVDC